MTEKSKLLPGTLELLILTALRRGPMHGYGIAQFIKSKSAGVLGAEEGSLYPALHRLAKRRLLVASWGKSESNRRARFYELTKEGRASLKSEIGAWEKFVQAVNAVIASPKLEA